MGLELGAGLLFGGLASAGASVAGGIMQSNAAKAAGEAQHDAALEQVKFSREALAAQIQARKDAVALAEKYGPLSAGEIKNIDKVISTRDIALSATMDKIQKMQASLDAADPSVKAAGQNLYEALTKETSNATSPVLKLRQRQRNELMGQLQSQMGPGFMTSSAGIEAMTKFDEATDRFVLDAQQGAVNNFTTLAGFQLQGQNAVTAATSDAYGKALVADTNVLQAEQVARNRTLSATTGSYNANQPNFLAPANAQYNVMQTAGNPFQGQMSMGQTLGQIGQGIGQIVGQQAGAGFFNNTGNYGSILNSATDIASKAAGNPFVVAAAA